MTERQSARDLGFDYGVRRAAGTIAVLNANHDMMRDYAPAWERMKSDAAEIPAACGLIALSGFPAAHVAEYMAGAEDGFRTALKAYAMEWHLAASKLRPDEADSWLEMGWGMASMIDDYVIPDARPAG